MDDDRPAHPLAVTHANRHVTTHMANPHVTVAITVVVLANADTVRADANPHIIGISGDGHTDGNGGENSKSKRAHMKPPVFMYLHNGRATPWFRHIL